jgi:hypothetical protein
MKPNASYDGKSLDGTGLEMSYNSAVLKSSIKQLKRANPRVKVLVSVGGAAYSDWGRLDARSIAQFVRNTGLDGVDIDFEPNAPQCRVTEAGVACDSDAILRSAVTALRNALPRPVVLSVALANVGAYGEGDWRSATPRGSATYGVDLALLRDEALTNSLDFVSIMAYDAGSTYRPLEAFRAVRHYYKGPVLIGFTPPPEAWGGHRYSAYEVREVLQRALKDKGGGAMLFSIGKGGQEPPSLENPDATILIDTITDVLRRKD